MGFGLRTVFRLSGTMAGDHSQLAGQLIIIQTQLLEGSAHGEVRNGT
jgi:hypothetical protein